MKLTATQKLHALIYRFYQGSTWTPRAGDIADQKTSNGIRTAVAAALATITLSGCQTLPLKESHPGHEYRPVTVETPCCDIDPPPVKTASTRGA